MDTIHFPLRRYLYLYRLSLHPVAPPPIPRYPPTPLHTIVHDVHYPQYPLNRQRPSAAVDDQLGAQRPRVLADPRPPPVRPPGPRAPRRNRLRPRPRAHRRRRRPRRAQVARNVLRLPARARGRDGGGSRTPHAQEVALAHRGPGGDRFARRGPRGYQGAPSPPGARACLVPVPVPATRPLRDAHPAVSQTASTEVAVSFPHPRGPLEEEEKSGEIPSACDDSPGWKSKEKDCTVSRAGCWDHPTAPTVVLIASTHRTRRNRNTESTTLSLYYLWRGCDAYLLYCTIYCARRVVLRSMLYVPCTDDLFRRKKRDDEWTTSLTIIDRREQCFIYISGCKIRTLPMRIEMCLGCIQKPSHLVRDSPGRPRPKASVCLRVFYTY